jgi:Arc/MetJ family transcription regulator
MRRTNVKLDENLVQECLKTTGLKTKKVLTNHALSELLRHENQLKILQLKGISHGRQFA